MPRSVIWSNHYRLRHHKKESQRGFWSNSVLKSCSSCLQLNYSSFYSSFSEANLNCKLKQYKIIKRLREPSLNISTENIPWGVLKHHQIREGKKSIPKPSMKNCGSPELYLFKLGLQVPAAQKISPHFPNDANCSDILKNSKTFKYNFSLLSRLMISKKTILRNERGK